MGNYNSYLVRACQIGDLVRVKEYLDRGADVCCDDNLPVQTAIENGHLEIMKLLLEKGARTRLSEPDNNIFISACEYDNLDVVKYLVEEFGVDPTAGFNPEGLLKACRSGALNVVLYLLDKGLDIDQYDVHQGEYPLTMAVRYHRYEIVQALLEKNADIHVGDDRALCLAVEQDDFRMVKILIEHGADVDASDFKPLYTALTEGYKVIAELLRENGASFRVKNKNEFHY